MKIHAIVGFLLMVLGAAVIVIGEFKSSQGDGSTTGGQKLEAMAKRTRKSRALVVREADIRAAIKQWLELDGWHVFVLEAGLLEKSRKYVGEEGMPDLLAIRYAYPLTPQHPHPLWDKFQKEAYVLWIEAKSRTAKHRAAQKAWQTAERQRGALVWVQRRDFAPTFSAFQAHYRASGLLRREGL